MNPIFPTPPPQYNISNPGEGILVLICLLFLCHPLPDLKMYAFLQEIDLQAFWHQPQLGSGFRSADTGAYGPTILPVRGRVVLHVPTTILYRLVALLLLSAIFGIVPLTALVLEFVKVVGSGLLEAFLVLYYLIAGFN
jgi:hypothetical protein